MNPHTASKTTAAERRWRRRWRVALWLMVLMGLFCGGSAGFFVGYRYGWADCASSEYGDDRQPAPKVADPDRIPGAESTKRSIRAGNIANESRARWGLRRIAAKRQVRCGVVRPLPALDEGRTLL